MFFFFIFFPESSSLLLLPHIFFFFFFFPVSRTKEGGPQGDVYAFIQYNPGLNDEVAVRLIMEPFLNGVQVLHAQGLIHRDIMSESILMNMALHVKIADFGLSINTKCERANTRCVDVSLCLSSLSVSLLPAIALFCCLLLPYATALPCCLLLPSPAPACCCPPQLAATALPCCCLLLPSPAAACHCPPLLPATALPCCCLLLPSPAACCCPPLLPATAPPLRWPPLPY